MNPETGMIEGLKAECCCKVNGQDICAVCKTHAPASGTPETDIAVDAGWDGRGWDDLIELAGRLERERDEAVRACHIWQNGHAKLVEECERWRRRDEDRAAAQERNQRQLLLAAAAVVARWDSPSWRDLGPTAKCIHALRDAVANASPTTSNQ